ncbi:hypothetical protein B0H17DRAFT_1209340 [Mycena rosella]|uniref:Uncharacterized protein n=1 Tax=Mycena rosella TaxID=1033263 RepID=A0AAD7G697_MYCRO|nr:hypothetical protein B0H17DRAFT_1209340 [Mycena rosella]
MLPSMRPRHRRPKRARWLHSGTKTPRRPFMLPSMRPRHRRPKRAVGGAPKLMAAMAPLGHQGGLSCSLACARAIAAEARRRRRAQVDGSDGSTRAPSSEQTTRRPFMLPSMRPRHRRPKRAVGGTPKLMAVMAPLGHQGKSQSFNFRLFWLIQSSEQTFKTPFVLPSKRPSHRRPQRAADGAPKLMAAMAPLGHQERTFEKHFEPPGVRPCHRRPKRTVVVTPSFMALSEESDTKLGADAPGALRVPLGCDE